MVRQPSDDWEISVQLSWQRLLALLVALAGMLILGYGLIRPTLSVYLGREVSRQLNAEIAREVVVILSGEGVAPNQPAPAAGAAGTLVAPDSAAQGAEAGTPPVTLATQPALANVDILRAVAEQPAAEPAGAPVAAQPAAEPAGAPMAAQSAAEPAGAPVAAQLAAEVPVGTPSTSPEPRSAEQIVAALPSGTLTVSEAKINARIAERTAALGPIEDLRVRFLPGQVQVDITVLGQASLGTAELTITEGRVVAQKPTLSEPLQLFVSATDLVKPIEDELNAILAAAEREVTDVQITAGELIVTLK